MILLCGLEAQLASYSQQSVEQMDRDFAASNPLFGQTVTQKKRRQHKGLVVDIRSVEEYPALYGLLDVKSLFGLLDARSLYGLLDARSLYGLLDAI